MSKIYSSAHISIFLKAIPKNIFSLLTLITIFTNLDVREIEPRCLYQG